MRSSTLLMMRRVKYYSNQAKSVHLSFLSYCMRNILSSFHFLIIWNCSSLLRCCVLLCRAKYLPLDDVTCSHNDKGPKEPHVLAPWHDRLTHLWTWHSSIIIPNFTLEDNQDMQLQQHVLYHSPRPSKSPYITATNHVKISIPS